MFTGIIQAVGHIVSERREGDGLRIAVSCGPLDVSDVRSGDSIAVSGCCLTAVSIEDATLRFDVSTETLRCTTGLDRPRAVNLEKAMRAMPETLRPPQKQRLRCRRHPRAARGEAPHPLRDSLFRHSESYAREQRVRRSTAAAAQEWSGP